jgi:hypothetical protein
VGPSGLYRVFLFLYIIYLPQQGQKKKKVHQRNHILEEMNKENVVCFKLLSRFLNSKVGGGLLDDMKI